MSWSLKFLYLRPGVRAARYNLAQPTLALAPAISLQCFNVPSWEKTATATSPPPLARPPGQDDQQVGTRRTCSLDKTTLLSPNPFCLRI